MDIKEQFEKAITDSKSLVEKPGNDVLLQRSGLSAVLIFRDRSARTEAE